MDIAFIQERLDLAFRTYVAGLLDLLPGLIGGMLVLLLGWLIAKLLRLVVVRVAGRTLDPMAARSGMDQVIGKFGGLTFGILLGGLVYWLTMLVFLLAASDVMGLRIISTAIGAAFAYLPTLVTATAILLFGSWGADKVNKLVSQLTTSAGLSGGRIVSKALAGLIVVFTVITALNVAGIDTSLITANIQIIIAGLLLAFAISYGAASRTILTNILSSYYGKERFKPGMRIRIGEDEGLIERIDSISFTLRKEDREVMLPTSLLISERIEVLEMPDEKEPT
ncbi:MAG: hypothetical protein KDC00_08660 [Flavobacteriales bacterium]|nr:hypothetical protein [Flavobacteriales bacterium]